MIVTLNCHYHTTRLIEINCCKDTCPEQQLQAYAQLSHIAENHVLHVILLGVGGVIYIPHSSIPLRSLGLDLQRANETGYVQ